MNCLGGGRWASLTITTLERHGLTDAELITAAQSGDTAAWGELYARWLPWVWRYAYSLVGNRHTAEDITSEAMIAWVRRLKEPDVEAPRLAAWLRQVVKNKAADHFRGTGRLRKAVEGVAAIRGNGCSLQNGAAALEADETRDQVRGTLAEMSEHHRLVLEWKYTEKMSVRDIAERLGATEKSIEATLYRARSDFRRRIEQAERLGELPQQTLASGGQGAAGAGGKALANGSTRLVGDGRMGSGDCSQPRTCRDEA